MALERIQKLLARAGLGSRRACEEILTSGRVTVDGRIVAELGAKADLAAQDVRVDGQRVKPEQPEYWILNKPKGVVCTNYDPAGRRRPIDLMAHSKARLFPVGRLDADSMGLLLMTNDGEFANRLTHPRFEVPKTYVATVAGDLTREAVHRLVRGIWLAEGRTRRAEVRLVKRSRSKSVVEVTMREGRNRQIRRMLAKLGHNVWDLVRTRIGKISLRGVSVGQSRRLTPEELEYLRGLPDQPAPERPRPVQRPPAQAGQERGEAPQREGAAPPLAAGRREGPPGRFEKPRRPRPVREREWRREPTAEERGVGPEPPYPFQKPRGEGRPVRPAQREPRPQERGPAARGPKPFKKEFGGGGREGPWRRGRGSEEHGPAAGGPKPFKKEFGGGGREGPRRRERGSEERGPVARGPKPFKKEFGGGGREGPRRRGRGSEERGPAARGPKPFKKEFGGGRREGPSRREDRREHSGPPPGAAGRREKRSPKTHDTGGAGKTGEGHGRRPGRGGGGRRFGRGGPPGRGRRPGGHPPQ
jgi:23S rRNA pseudouridine2605 synthase